MTRNGGRSNFRANLMIALVSFVITGCVAFTAGEMLLRLTRPYATPETVRNSSLQYEPTLFSRHAFPQGGQNVPFWDGDGSVVINRRGYRGRDFAVPKPEGTVRIVFLGGSAAFDIFAPEGKDWPRLVEQDLRSRGFQRVEVVNAATPGHATWDSLGRLYAEIWMFQPDYVVIYEAWNDIKYFRWLNPDQSLLRSYRPAVPANDMSMLVGNPYMYYTSDLDRLLSHSQLYVRLRWRYLQWGIGNIGLEGVQRTADDWPIDKEEPYADSYSEWGPRQFQLNLSLLAEAARSIGATPVFLTQARLSVASNGEADRKRIGYDLVGLSHHALVRAFADTDRAILAVAREKGVPVLDLSGMFSGQSELFHDEVHTTTAGSEALARATADFLAGILEKR
ncbi:MAG: SGNH/GDSL hydrolase family protein [Chloroflexi bacterium]|nr:SGNH/GDSL hydrolase family protein [Chloroflexota bacterium]